MNIWLWRGGKRRAAVLSPSHQPALQYYTLHCTVIYCIITLPAVHYNTLSTEHFTVYRLCVLDFLVSITLDCTPKVLSPSHQPCLQYSALNIFCVQHYITFTLYLCTGLFSITLHCTPKVLCTLQCWCNCPVLLLYHFSPIQNPLCCNVLLLQFVQFHFFHLLTFSYHFVQLKPSMKHNW